MNHNDDDTRGPVAAMNIDWMMDHTDPKVSDRTLLWRCRFSTKEKETKIREENSGKQPLTESFKVSVHYNEASHKRRERGKKNTLRLVEVSRSAKQKRKRLNALSPTRGKLN